MSVYGSTRTKSSAFATNLNSNIRRFDNRNEFKRTTAIGTKQIKNPTTKPTMKTYKAIFDKIFHNRMQFYYRLSAILAMIVTLILYLPSTGKLIFLPIKISILWIGYFVLQKARSRTITTEFCKASNQIHKCITLLCSRKLYILGAAFLFNNIMMSLIIFSQSDSSLNYYIETPTKTIKPFVNDNFAFFCFFTIFSSIFYTLNYVFSEKFILHVPMGTYRQEPIEYLTKLPYLKLLIISILKSIIAILFIPLTYHIFFRNLFFHTFLKPLVILNNLNNQLPRSDFNFAILFKLAFCSCVQFLSYELLNELFNAYALIGCLVVKKPISQFSDTPFQTLLSGIKDYKNPLVRLTAFQELVYLSTSPDFKDRQLFYRADNWNLLLAEFFFVLTNAARSARSELPKNNESTALLREERIQNLKKQASLFGNLNNYKKNNNFDFDFDVNTDSNDKKEEFNEENDITVIKSDNDKIFQNPVPKEEKISDIEVQYNSLVISLYNSLSTLIKKFQIFINTKFNIDYAKLGGVQTTKENSVRYQLNVLYMDMIIFTRHLFLGDIYEQSNKRLPNKEIVGFSIIALTEMLIHAKIEDKHNSVTSTLTESLTLLTKIYKGTSEFLNNPPTDLNSSKESSIMVINELSISYFFKLVIYYNNILNDLLLPPEVFKLAKWCTDMALEQQREQKISVGDILP